MWETEEENRRDEQEKVMFFMQKTSENNWPSVDVMVEVKVTAFESSFTG